MKRAGWKLDALVALGIVTNLVALGLFLWLRPRAGLYRFGERIPVPSGYLAGGQILPAAPHPCYLVRLTSDACPFCRKDEPQLQKLASTAGSAHCEVVFVAARADAVRSAPPGAKLLQGVDLHFGRALVPYVIPQTLLLNRGGKIVWYQVGSMNAAALSAATKALAGNR